MRGVAQGDRGGPEAGGRPKKNRDGTDPVTRRRRNRAGMSERQRKDALRVANIPEADFEKVVESEKPPTITQLSEAGKREADSGVRLANELLDLVVWDLVLPKAVTRHHSSGISFHLGRTRRAVPFFHSELRPERPLCLKPLLRMKFRKCSRLGIRLVGHQDFDRNIEMEVIHSWVERKLPVISHPREARY